MICGKKYVVSQVALSEPLRPSVIELFFVLAEVVQTNVDKEVSDLQAVDSRRLDPLSDKPCQLDILPFCGSPSTHVVDLSASCLRTVQGAPPKKRSCSLGSNPCRSLQSRSWLCRGRRG